MRKYISETVGYYRPRNRRSHGHTISVETAALAIVLATVGIAATLYLIWLPL
jgi:hypothetical protein